MRTDSLTSRLLTRACFACLLVLPLAAWQPAQAQLRVIVNRGNPMTDVSTKELARYFRGDYGMQPNGARVLLAEQTRIRATYARLLFGQDEDQFKRQWIRVVFAGNPVAPPTAFSSLEELEAYVAKNVGAIAIVSGVPDETVKVLTVNGKAPGDPGYLLK